MLRRALIVTVALAAVLGLATCSGGSSSPSRSSPSSQEASAEASASGPPGVAPPTPPSTDAERPVPGAVPAGVRPPVVTSATAAAAQASAGGSGGGAVALTFDADLTPGMRQRLRDGRVDSYANMAVIDILQSTGTPATIFFTGLWMEEYPAETRRIAADGRFELATHSQTHRAFTGHCYGLDVVPTAEMADEVRLPMEALAAFTDRPTRYFRFPGLCHDDAALDALAPLGITVVDGDSSGDAGGRSVDAIVDQTLRAARAGSIIVMHLNGGDAAPLTDDALPRILDGLHAKGLRPTTLTDLLVPAP